MCSFVRRWTCTMCTTWSSSDETRCCVIRCGWVTRWAGSRPPRATGKSGETASAVSPFCVSGAQQARGVAVVELPQDSIRKAQAINIPAPLRRLLGGRVREILILGLEEAVVDLIQRVAEQLLRDV